MLSKEFIENLPVKPPQEAIEHYKTKLSKKNILIYQSTMAYFPLEDRRRKAVKVKCTACGEEYIEERCDFEIGCTFSKPPAPFGFTSSITNEIVYTNSDTFCACCGAPVRAAHISNFHNSLVIGDWFFNTVSELDGALCILSWCLRKSSDKEGNIHYGVTMADGNIFKEKRSYAVSAFVRNYNRYTGYTNVYRGFWKEVSWENKIGTVDKDDIYPFDENILIKTGYENCKLDKFINDNERVSPAIYMEIYKKYPAIENLVVCGLSKLLQEKFIHLPSTTKSSIPNYLGLDLNKKKPYQLLRLNSKTELSYAKKHRFSDEWYRFYADFKKRVSIEEIHFLKKSYSTWDLRKLDLVTARFNVRLTTILSYIDKQIKRYGKKHNINMYRDYITALSNITDIESITRDMLFPKNLKTQHDSATQRWAQIKYEQEAEKNKMRSTKIEKRAKKLTYLCYENEHFSIKPCPSDEALFIEGKTLSHCVYNYADRYADGSTTILFIRKKDAPNTPFFTLEYNKKSKTIAQNHGYDNDDPPEEVVLFTNEWLEFIKNVMKKEKQNGKSNCSKSAEPIQA